ncbi:DNA-binding protein [Calocera viscosa TUFC12733]|uniref:DNA-binding protein n=1 Tax=Calocera viscosa (strain TUFC12733) TaxID=1330018 RepID=A0A167RQ54_CALVF|nr:DNA-binding protein [Calocera viscosa TUFC12733]
MMQNSIEAYSEPNSSHVHPLLRFHKAPSRSCLRVSVSHPSPLFDIFPFLSMMQSQVVRTRQDQTITQEQSLQTVKSMLSAGFSCIAYLRGILPTDNFVDGYVSNDPASQSHASKPSPRSNQVKLKTVKRGHSAAGDKLLNYLEHGIFDALEKQYLKSFMFAVYLDSKDPNSIIECFTFSFSYQSIPGTDTVVPVLSSLNDDMEKLSLSKTGRKMSAQQVVAKGKVPTLGEVKASVKNLIKRLIMTTQMMEELPPQRYVTFKLFYVEGTPDDYEPPLFRAADADTDRFFFSTHDVGERPEKTSIGSIATSFHGVDVNITSICDIVPRRNQHLEDLPFDAELPASQILSDEQRRSRFRKEMNAQREDARSRRVVWDAEGRAFTHDSLQDGDGEPDPDFEGQVRDLNEEQPLGFRDQDGNVTALSDAATEMEIDIDPAYAGSQENDSDFQDQYDVPVKTKPITDPTQCLPKNVAGQTAPANETLLTSGINTLDLNTVPSSLLLESSISDDFHSNEAINNEGRNAHSKPVSSSTRSLRPRGANVDGAPAVTSRSLPPDTTMNGERHCCCDIHLRSKKDEEESDKWCQCEGSCGKWYHVWCMGYISVKAFQKQYPNSSGARWLCFECRFRKNPLATLLTEDDKQTRISNFKDLALFRFTIKLVLESKSFPDGPSALRRRLGCGGSTAISLWQRLEDEGFIAPVSEEDSIDSVQGDTGFKSGHKPKSKPKVRRGAKVRYTLTPSSARLATTKTYFDGSYKKEDEIMGLKELRRDVRLDRKRKNALDEEESTNRAPIADTESQTQLMENALPPFPLSAGARNQGKEVRTYSQRPRKKPKVSLAQQAIGVEM